MSNNNPHEAFPKVDTNLVYGTKAHWLKVAQEIRDANGGIDKRRTPQGRRELSNEWLDRAKLTPASQELVYKELGVDDSMTDEQRSDAIKAWQGKQKIGVDGTVGMETLGKVIQVFKNNPGKGVIAYAKDAIENGEEARKLTIEAAKGAAMGLVVDTTQSQIASLGGDLEEAEAQSTQSRERILNAASDANEARQAAQKSAESVVNIATKGVANDTQRFSNYVVKQTKSATKKLRSLFQ